MQEMICRPGIGLGPLIDRVPSVAAYFRPRLIKVVPNQRRLLNYFRASVGKVVYTTIGAHTRDGSDLTPWRRRRNAKMDRAAGRNTYYEGNQGQGGIIPELIPMPGEVVIRKATFGAFASTALEHLLRNWNVKQLVICGEATNVCVYMTAAEAADRGFDCVVAEDACAAWSEALHLAFLENYALLFGRVATTDEVLNELRRASRRGRSAPPPQPRRTPPALEGD